MLRHNLFAGQNKIISRPVGALVTGLLSFYGGYKYGQQQSTQFNVPFAADDSPLPPKFETLAHLFDDPFNGRPYELQYWLDKHKTSLSSEQVCYLAELAVNREQGLMLNTLTAYFPEILDSEYVFKLIDKAGNSRLIQSLLSTSSDSVSPELRKLLATAHTSPETSLSIIDIDYFETFFSRLQSSRVQTIRFIAHNGESHDDGRLVKGTYTHRSGQAPSLVLHGHDDNAHALEQLCNAARKIEPSINLSTNITSLSPSDFRP